jgi:Flp pilus assembly protein TadG
MRGKQAARSGMAGTAMVEFALVLPLLLTLAFGILQFGKAFNYWIDETHLANEGARWAVVNSNPCGTSVSLQQCVRDQADVSELNAGMSVCITQPAGATGYTVGQPVEMKVQYDYPWLSWFQNLGFPTTVKISASAIMRLEANYSPGADVGTCV